MHWPKKLPLTMPPMAPTTGENKSTSFSSPDTTHATGAATMPTAVPVTAPAPHPTNHPGNAKISMTRLSSNGPTGPSEPNGLDMPCAIAPVESISINNVINVAFLAIVLSFAKIV